MRRLLWRLGFKPYLFRCPKGEHDWRQTFGDERMQVGAIYLCRNCPRKTSSPKNFTSSTPTTKEDAG